MASELSLLPFAGGAEVFGALVLFMWQSAEKIESSIVTARKSEWLKGLRHFTGKRYGLTVFCYLENHFDGTLARLTKQARLAKRGKSTLSCAVPITIMSFPKGRKDRRASCRISCKQPFPKRYRISQFPRCQFAELIPSLRSTKHVLKRRQSERCSNSAHL